MKVIWDAEDVVCGRVFGIPGVKECGIIGYDPRESDSQAKYTLISLLDGMIICPPMSKYRIAEHLNDSDYQPIELLKV